MTAALARPGSLNRAESRRRFAMAADGRLRFMLIGLLLIGGVLLARIGQIVIGGFFTDAHATVTAPYERADIVDRNGVAMARTITVQTIRVVKTRVMHDPRVLANALATIFPETSAATFHARLVMDPAAILGSEATPARIAAVVPMVRRYRQDRNVANFADALTALVPAKDNAHWRQRVISNSAATIASRATLAQLNAVNDLAEIAFEYPEQQRRLYPQGSIAAHVLGFVIPGRGGAMGVERAFNQQLTAPSTRGTALALSLDARVQAALDLELGNAVTQLEAAGGAALVLDVTSGEVLGMSSYPTFDPNNVRFATPEAQWNGVTYSTFELGSSFKPITMAAAMDAGVVTDLSRRYDATRPLIVGGHPIRDSHPSNRWLNVPETLIHSSNIVTAQIADRLGADRLRATFRSVGFDRRPSIELGERGMPQWATPWGRTTTMTAGFGHSITVTPLHLATAYAALVNGGMYHPPTIIKRDPNAPVPGHRVFTEATSSRMRQLLRLIVTDGTGSRADAPGFLVGGKTGSAERAVGGRYVGNSVVATFAGVFPMNRPRYVVLVMIDRPPGNAYSMGQRTAAYTAAPVVRRTVQRIGPMLGIYPDMRRDLDLSDLRPLIWRPAGDRAARRPAVAVDAQ